MSSSPRDSSPSGSSPAVGSSSSGRGTNNNKTGKLKIGWRDYKNSPDKMRDYFRTVVATSVTEIRSGTEQLNYFRHQNEVYDRLTSYCDMNLRLAIDNLTVKKALTKHFSLIAPLFDVQCTRRVDDIPEISKPPVSLHVWNHVRDWREKNKKRTWCREMISLDVQLKRLEDEESVLNESTQRIHTTIGVLEELVNNLHLLRVPSTNRQLFNRITGFEPPVEEVKEEEEEMGTKQMAHYDLQSPTVLPLPCENDDYESEPETEYGDDEDILDFF